MKTVENLLNEISERIEYLKAKQQSLELEAEQYNLDNGSNLSISDYSSLKLEKDKLKWYRNSDGLIEDAELNSYIELIKDLLNHPKTTRRTSNNVNEELILERLTFNYWVDCHIDTGNNSSINQAMIEFHIMNISDLSKKELINLQATSENSIFALYCRGKYMIESFISYLIYDAIPEFLNGNIPSNYYFGEEIKIKEWRNTEQCPVAIENLSEM